MNQVSKASSDLAFCGLTTKRKALQSYKRLLRTRLEVFRGDDFAIKESHAAIRDAFEKNRNLTDQDQIIRSIDMAEQAEKILRNEVMQAKFVTDDTVRLNVRLDNVKDNKTFRFADED